VNVGEMLLVQAAMSASASITARTDVNGDGHVTAADLELVAQSLGASSVSSSSPSQTPRSPSDLPRIVGAPPVFSAPAPTHGFSWVVDEWISSLPDVSDDLPADGATPPQAAPPPIVRPVSPGGAGVVRPVGGDSGTGGSETGTPLAPPTQAAAIVDRVFSGLARVDRVRKTSDVAPNAPRIEARRAGRMVRSETERYASLVASISTNVADSLAATRRERTKRGSAETAARQAAFGPDVLGAG
jgi:hypothetical protein